MELEELESSKLTGPQQGVETAESWADRNGLTYGTARAWTIKGVLPATHRPPHRAMLQGEWSNPRYTGLYLRETQAIEPTAEALERCLQQWQIHGLRSPARTVRTDG